MLDCNEVAPDTAPFSLNSRIAVSLGSMAVHLMLAFRPLFIAALVHIKDSSHKNLWWGRSKKLYEMAWTSQCECNKMII